MTVLAFVEASEYRKEVARRLGRSLLAELGLDAILDGGDDLADELLGILAEDLEGLLRQAARDAIAHARFLGLVEVEEAAAVLTLTKAQERVLETARATLALRLADLDGTVERMLERTGAAAVEAALSTAAIADALLAPISAVLSQTGAGIVQAVESELHLEAVAATDEKADEPALFEWETREDDKVCEDVLENSCRPRHGEQLTLEEWELFGLPQGETLICTIFAKGDFSNCRCRLIPAGSAVATPEPVNIAEAAKAGKERALKEAA